MHTLQNGVCLPSGVDGDSERRVCEGEGGGVVTPKIIFMPYISTYWVEKEMREAINRWWNRKDESWFRKAVSYLRMKKECYSGF
jgi:hypothetical protein